jgi:diamine N-acetyltransferase
MSFSSQQQSCWVFQDDFINDNNKLAITMLIPVITEIQAGIIESLAKEIWTEYYIPIIGKAQVDYMLCRFQSKQAVLEQIDNGTLYFLMRDNDVFVGYMAVYARKQELFLSKIYVRSSERGKGYGRSAVQFAEALAKERSLAKLVLTVNKHNTNTIHVYEKIGFKKTCSLFQDIGDGFFMDDFCMEKEIM